MATALGVTLASAAAAPAAHADNRRFNSSVVANVYAVQRQAECTGELNVSPQLLLAAEWHARDLMANRSLGGDVGTDGSTPQQRAEAAGFHGTASEAVAIHPALAISGIELINLWYHNPAYYSMMADCANTRIGVWSENSLDRTVVVAMFGRPD